MARTSLAWACTELLMCILDNSTLTLDDFTAGLINYARNGIRGLTEFSKLHSDAIPLFHGSTDG